MSRLSVVAIVAAVLAVTAFAGNHTKLKFAPITDRLSAESVQGVPSNVDWRKKGYVSPPITNGQCPATEVGDAIATNIGGIAAVKSGKYSAVSIQDIVTCAMGGCHPEGEEVDLTKIMGYIVKKQGGYVPSATVVKPTCPWTIASNQTVAAKIVGGRALPKDEKVMANYVATKGPIVVGVDASTMEMYTGGVFTGGRCPKNPEIDTVMSVVGFNLDAKPAYWILKNSWGPMWGEHGYIRLEYGVGACAVNQMAFSAEL